MEFANEFYDLVTTYLGQLTGLVTSIPDVDNTVSIPDVNTDVDTTDLEALVRDFPVDPISGVTWPDPPTDTLVFNEDTDYSEDLFNAFDTKLQNVLADVTTLLNGTIENDILYRETERDAIVNQDAMSAKADEWAERGFELPGAGLFNNIGQVDTEYQNTLLTKSRDIAVESRKLEIENTQKILETINSFESIRMQYKSQYWTRRLDAAKTLLERGTIIFAGQIEVIKTKALTYQALTAAYASRAGALSDFAKVKFDGVRAAIEYASVQVNASVAELNSEISELEARYGLALEGVKSQANLAAQIMASALSAVSASAQISSSDSANMSTSLGSSEHWQHYMDESPA
jgi:hypothetical protein